MNCQAPGRQARAPGLRRERARGVEEDLGSVKRRRLVHRKVYSTPTVGWWSSVVLK